MRAALILAALGSLTASAGHGEEIQISMAGQAYAPAVTEASVGDTIVFINDDDTSHDVFIPTVGFATDLGKQDAFAETRLTLGQPGAFDVECVFHDHMHARVVVTP